MMTRAEITIGLLSLLGVIAITAWIGLDEGVMPGDNGRLAKASVGFNMRSVESGAQMFDQYCASCHGPNAAGANCPPLDEHSGIHGGDLGEGVAWRLEEMHWDRADAYGFVYSTISAGRMVSSRPDRYQGTDPKAMAMPAWSQQYGGPLRPDQIKDLANYVVNFRSYLPSAKEEGAYAKGCEAVMDSMAPSVATYSSKCYEKLCVVAYEAKGRTPPKAPELEGPKDDPANVAIMNRYWESFWAGCKAVGGQTPPEQATPTSAAPAEGTPATDGTPAADGAAAADGTPAAKGSPAAGGTSAATGSTTTGAATTGTAATGSAGAGAAARPAGTSAPAQATATKKP